MSFPAYTFPSLVLAQRCINTMDDPVKGVGPYPKPGVDVGGGVHVPPAQSQTITYAALYRNAAGTLWAYTSDPNSSVLLPVQFPVPGVTTVDFTTTWFGAVQVWP